ncbi:MAG: peroxiredoxin family protein [Fimbriiglobus sp.]|jgi:hypothetical protein|nr:peroxiredoxin family protein [Fimbriiglobus sp.]
MPTVGLALLALAATPAADKVGLSGPRFARGEELVYAGEVVESADLVEGRFTKKYGLEVRVFVLEAGKDGSDCAVMTRLTPKADTAVTNAVKATAGAKVNIRDEASAVRLELVRIDPRGGVKVLTPEPKLPLLLDDKTPATAPPPLPTDAPTTLELGVFLPLPPEATAIGDTWDTPDAQRPPVVWVAKQAVVWNGRRVAEVTGIQRTDGFDSPKTVRTGWQRSEAVYVSPADGLVSYLARTVVRREGVEPIGSVTTTLELQPTARHVGEKYKETRAEVEAGWVFGAELEQLRAERAKADQLQTLRRQVIRFTDQRPTATGFRPALDAVLRRSETNIAPPVTVRKMTVEIVETVAVGKPAPDFSCADVDRPTTRARLSAMRGKPTVVVFFKPGSETSEDTLTVCEALFRRYGEKATVLPLALGGDLRAASRQRESLKFGVPVFDGTEVREKYTVTSVPQFFLVDADGVLRWTFEAGIGPEVGSLVRKELEKVLK